MLHIVIATHGPETCPASVQHLREKALPELRRLDEAAKGLGIEVKGGWGDMPAHTLYFLLDAPNAHVINRLAVELHLMDWNTVAIYPVITLEEVTSTAQERPLLAA